jgi:hypothetical protein
MKFLIIRKYIWISAFMLLMAIGAQAQVKWLWDFEGTLGPEKIGFTLVTDKREEFPRDTDLDCSYFHVEDLIDIALRCNIAKDGSLTFEERDANGKVVAVFKGRLLKNEIDEPQGDYSKTGAGPSIAFKLRMVQETALENGRRYSMIEAADDAVFEQRVRDFRLAVLQGDKRKAVSCIKFPIPVYLAKKSVKIKNKASFLRVYDRIFTREFVEEIRATVPHNMFHRDMGAMLGHGSVWFWGDGKVIGLNN